MVRISIILSFLLFISCSQPNLQHTTASSLLEVVGQEKGEKAVLLNFWATTCAPCVEEFPMVVELGKKYEDDLAVIFVSMDWLEDKEKARSFIRKQDMSWTTYIKNEKDNPFINGIHPDWSGAIPFTILYGKNSGEVVDFWEGEQPEERFSKAVLAAINS